MNITKLKNRLGDKLQGLQENTEKRQVQTMTKKALATVNSNYIALTNNAIDIIRENLKQQPLSFQLFDIVKEVLIIQQRPIIDLSTS